MVHVTITANRDFSTLSNATASANNIKSKLDPNWNVTIVYTE